MAKTELARISLRATIGAACLGSVMLLADTAIAAATGLPFVDNFDDAASLDPDRTTANWNPAEQALHLAFVQRYGATVPGGVTATDAGGAAPFPDQDRTAGLARGDVDGDGDIDYVAVNSAGITRLYLNNGQADPFSDDGRDISTDDILRTSGASSAALGDVDGDGDTDLVIGLAGRANLLFLNNGSPDPFAGVSGVSIGGDAESYVTASVVLGDLDGDGDLDLVTATDAGYAPNRYYLNAGGPNPFDGGGRNLGDDHLLTKSVALADMDGDGHLDAVTGNDNAPNRIFFNNGTAIPFDGVTGSPVGADSDRTFSLGLGDVDGDGDIDIVAGNRGQPHRLYLNDGTASPFGAAPGSNVTDDTGIDTEAVALGDLDGDGDLDVVEGNFNRRNRLILNNGSSDPFTGASIIPLTDDDQQTTALDLADFDGDGRLDVLAANFNQANRLYRIDRELDRVEISADNHPTYAVAAGDVDGDGDIDLVVGNTTQDNRPNQLYLNNGTPSPFDGVVGIPLGADIRNTNSLALGDIDNDGDLDLVEGNNGVNRLFLNTGDPVAPFDNAAASDVGPADNTQQIKLGDLNGDGFLDLVVANRNDPSRFFLGQGGSTPFDGATPQVINEDLPKNNFTGSYTAFYGVALGDIDGDGDIDMVFGTVFHPDVLYRNNGSPAPFAGVTAETLDDSLKPASFASDSLALGDLDGDGDLDLVLMNLLYLNDGSQAAFTDTIPVQLTDTLPSAIALGDVDKDADLDLLFARWGQPSLLFLNRGGTPPFMGQAGIGITDERQTADVALADMDSDGWPDLVTGNWFSTRNYLYPNVGRPHPTYAATDAAVTSGTVNALSDALDGVIVLRAEYDQPPNTVIDWFLSNDGGTRYHRVVPGRGFTFPGPGTDLRWRAVLSSLSPVRSPRIRGVAIMSDADLDGVSDGTDNCPNTPNPSQTNNDNDLLGDACDTDDDDDGVPDTVDNCPLAANPSQLNSDDDVLGDACDSDDDQDGTPDVRDAFPLDPDESQDTDGDGIGNNADLDDDGDGRSDAFEIGAGTNPLFDERRLHPSLMLLLESSRD